MKLGKGSAALALAAAMVVSTAAPSLAAAGTAGGGYLASNGYSNGAGFLNGAGYSNSNGGGGGHQLHHPTVVADGLNNPRGLSWASNSILLVAEAGRGGSGQCFPGVFTSNPMCYGRSGAVTAIGTHGWQHRIISGLPSIAEQGTGAFAFGPSDVSGRLGSLYVSIGGPGPQLDRSVFQDAAAKKLGTVQRAVGLYPTTVADLAAYELAHDPDQQLHESNTTSVLSANNKLYAIDAAGNTFFSIGRRGEVNLLKTFANRSANGLEYQAVPTALAQGPDGAIYLSDLAPTPAPGQAKVWRMGRDGVIKVYAEGFNTANDLAFGPDGKLYVLEVNPGSASRVVLAHPGGAPEVVIDTDAGLTFATGIAVGRDGSVYVTNCGNCAGTGTVLKFAA